MFLRKASPNTTIRPFTKANSTSQKLSLLSVTIYPLFLSLKKKGKKNMNASTLQSDIPPVYYNKDTDSFAFETARTRWDKILEDCIHDVDSQSERPGKLLVLQGLASLKQQLANNAEITKFTSDSINLIPSLQNYNDVIDQLHTDHCYWLTGPWLFLETYLYRRIDTVIKLQNKNNQGDAFWEKYDVFENLKQKSFKSSADSVFQLADRFKQLSTVDFLEHKNNEDQLLLWFKEFLDISLWGNKVDLSLLATKKEEEVINSGQTSEARKKAEKNIVSNDTKLIWQQIRKNNNSHNTSNRIDFVLDNSGFETFTDLLFAMFLLDTKITDKVKIHCKTRPWMVSDTMIKDIDILLKDLLDPSFFTGDGCDQTSIENLKFLHDKLHKLINVDHKIELVDHEFWTMGQDYWHLTKDNKYCADLFEDLSKSDMIFIKGDLNYRKLTGDRRWPKTTLFIDAIGTLSSSGLKIASLRTCKADVCVGLQEGVEEQLCKQWHESTGEPGNMWTNGGNWAVVSYSNGNTNKLL